MVVVAVGVLVVDGRVLLGLRSPDKHAHPNAWDRPGGVVGGDESELVALARELREELGVVVSPRSASLLCRAVVGDAADPAHLGVWLVEAWDGTPRNLAPAEHLELGWFAADELPPLVHPSVHESVLEALRSGARPSGV